MAADSARKSGFIRAIRASGSLNSGKSGALDPYALTSCEIRAQIDVEMPEFDEGKIPTNLMTMYNMPCSILNVELSSEFMRLPLFYYYTNSVCLFKRDAALACLSPWPLY